MKQTLWRIIYAVIVVVLLAVAIPLFLEVVHFPMPAAAMSLIWVCIGGLAVLYVFAGSPLPPP